MIRRLLALVLTLALATPVAAQTTIELRSSAVVRPGEPITLADVADIAGDDAERLGETVIMAAPSAAYVEVGLEAVRAALSEADVRWGRTTLRGLTCTAIVAGIDEKAAPKKVERKAAAAPAPVKLTGPETVRFHVVRALAHLYSVETTDLRMLFEDRDDDLLNTPTNGRRVDVQPTNSAATSRVGLRVYVFAADRLVAQRTISVEVLVRRTVVTAVAPIQRRQEIGAEDVAVSEQWHAPSAAPPCAPEQAIGSVARGRINAGQIITRAAVEAPVVVKKGDIVEVHCLSGSVHLKATRARALSAGRDGELVEFQLDGSKSTFWARMSGRGSAVLVLDPPSVAELGAAAESRITLPSK
jgi:flagella basal body P-ring formation protein FlgA